MGKHHRTAANPFDLEVAERHHDLPKGAEVTVPLWLARSLRAGRYVEIKVADHFAQARLEARDQSSLLR